ncbi:MAG: hypothetical protein IJ906_14705 [Oscillospiraceae bacterium]|nr:hypothetical protein [Oscillospiraceae bacterium]
MPQISKIRIVNFYYNNGHRMIPDELYDLTDAEGKHALDTLISLINGGGKSVLVQLMMQPVLPKARAAGRKLEGYFRRPGDHCFVVLEWLKDGSSEKLMTGIAIAAAQTAKAEETDSGTARIRYYTFYANYTDYTGNCNIIDLPLSGNEQEHFVPAEFEDVRKLARKSGGKMQVYSSDENAKWADQLAQYGIFQQEWRSLMQPLNSVEGGMAESPMLLAYYAEDAFRSRERFTESLQSARSQTETERDRLNSRITLLEEQIQTAVRFTYDAGWLTGQEQKIERILGEIASLEQTAGQLTDEKAALESEQQDVRQRLQESETAVHSAEERLEHIQAVLERLPQEEAFRNALDTARQQHAACQQALASASDEQKRLQAESDRLQNQIQQNDALCEELNAAIAKVQHCTGGEIQNGDWRGLLAQYEVLVKAQDASVREVQLQLDNVQANLRDARRELARIGCQPEQYQSVPYDEAEETRLKQQQSDIKADLADKNDAHLKCVQKEAADRANLDHAQNALRDFGGQPLSPSEIAGNYEQRTRKLDAERSALLTEQALTATRLQKLQRLSDRTALCLEKLPTPQQITETVLQEDAQKQWNALYGQFSEISREQQSMHHRLEESLRELSAGYPDGAEHSALLDMQTILRSQEGDIYYSLDSMMETSLGVTKKYIAKINSDLADFDDSKHDLVRQCVLQGQQIWNGLVKMEKSAAVTLSEERTKTKLIRFDLPEQVDEISAKGRICAELEQSVRELSDKLERGTLLEAELEKAAGRFVSSSRLLRTFIQKQQIGLKAFKIDSDKSLREYRTWESTAVDNSGAEKFLVYFAVILSVMHYTRSDDGISTQESTGVLILDNPFGVITSHHVLDKMFRIAKHFRVQLICLSDITKCDITACFSMHIKAKVKENKLSSVSLLTHEGNEQIEHGFYRASQMALL